MSLDPQTTLAVVVNGTERRLELGELQILRDAPRQSWYLADVIAFAGAPAPRTVRVVGDRELVIDAGDHVRLEVNNRGEVALRVWDIGGARVTVDVRRVTKIVVE